MLLKPNMILPSLSSDESPSADEVAQRTLETLRRCRARRRAGHRVSVGRPVATSMPPLRLNAMNSKAMNRLPWPGQFFVCARFAKRRDGDLGRQNGKCRGGASGVCQAVKAEQRGAARRVSRRTGIVLKRAEFCGTGGPHPSPPPFWERELRRRRQRASSFLKKSNSASSSNFKSQLHSVIAPET